MTSSDEYLFIKKLESAQNWQDIEVISIEKFNTLGLSRFIYIYIPPESYFDRQAFIIHHKGYKEDHVVLKGVKQLVYGTGEVPFMNMRVLDVLKPYFEYEPRLAKNGIYEDRSPANNEHKLPPFPGLVIPVFGPRSRQGLFGFTIEEDKTKPEYPRYLQIICQAIHQRYSEIWTPSVEQAIKLSQREKEVLMWVMLGKSNSIIADILSISPHTVDSFLRRIFRKLGVHDRVSAAIKVTELGLLNTFIIKHDAKTINET